MSVQSNKLQEFAMNVNINKHRANVQRFLNDAFVLADMLTQNANKKTVIMKHMYEPNNKHDSDDDDSHNDDSHNDASDNDDSHNDDSGKRDDDSGNDNGKRMYIETTENANANLEDLETINHPSTLKKSTKNQHNTKKRKLNSQPKDPTS